MRFIVDESPQFVSRHYETWEALQAGRGMLRYYRNIELMQEMVSSTRASHCHDAITAFSQH